MTHKSPFGGYDLPHENDNLSEEQSDLLLRLASKIVKGGWTVPAILFLESVKPLNYIGSQTMVFFEPFAQAIFRNIKDYNTFRVMMEKRDNVERLLQKIEELDAIQVQAEREIKKKYKAERKIKRKRFWRKLLGRELPDDTISIPEKKSPDGQ